MAGLTRYRIEFGGRLYTLEGPDDASEDELFEAVSAQAKAEPDRGRPPTAAELAALGNPQDRIPLAPSAARQPQEAVRRGTLARNPYVAGERTPEVQQGERAIRADAQAFDRWGSTSVLDQPAPPGALPAEDPMSRAGGAPVSREAADAIRAMPREQREPLMADAKAPTWARRTARAQQGAADAEEAGRERLADLADRDDPTRGALGNWAQRGKANIDKQVATLANAAGLIDQDSLSKALARAEASLAEARVSKEVREELANLQRANASGDWGEVMRSIPDNPRGFFAILADSIASSAPSIAVGAIPGVGLLGRVALSGATAGLQDAGSVLADELGEQKVNLMDAQAVRAKLQDREFLAAVEKKAATRGIVVGTASALSLGIAGRFMAPVIDRARTAGRVSAGRIAGATAAELGAQAGIGAGGELVAQRLTGDNKPLDVIAEGLGEAISGPVDVLANTREVRGAAGLARELERRADDGEIAAATQLAQMRGELRTTNGAATPGAASGDAAIRERLLASGAVRSSAAAVAGPGVPSTQAAAPEIAAAVAPQPAPIAPAAPPSTQVAPPPTIVTAEQMPTRVLTPAELDAIAGPAAVQPTAPSTAPRAAAVTPPDAGAAPTAGGELTTPPQRARDAAIGIERVTQGSLAQQILQRQRTAAQAAVAAPAAPAAPISASPAPTQGEPNERPVVPADAVAPARGADGQRDQPGGGAPAARPDAAAAGGLDPAARTPVAGGQAAEPAAVEGEPGRALKIATNPAAPESQASVAAAATPPSVQSQTTEVSTWKDANSARLDARSRGNTHRVVRRRQGDQTVFSVEPKTEAQIAAEQRAGARLQRARTRIDPNRDTLLTAIAKLGGLSTAERADTIGEGNRNTPGGAVFRSNGLDVDRMAQALVEWRYVPATERDDAVRWLQSAIQDEFAGRREFFSDDAENPGGNLNSDEYRFETPPRWDSQDLPDGADLIESGLDAESPAVQRAAEQLVALAEMLGVDVAAARERAAIATEEQDDAAYAQAFARELEAAIDGQPAQGPAAQGGQYDARAVSRGTGPRGERGGQAGEPEDPAPPGAGGLSDEPPRVEQGSAGELRRAGRDRADAAGRDGAALSAAAADDAVRRPRVAIPGAVVRALGISERVERGLDAQALVGLSAASPAELAELAQVFRNPRYETFRVFFTRGSEIVHATGVSARMPGATPLMPGTGTVEQWAAWLNDQKQASGADGYYLLHNHPSGSPQPSRADERVTMVAAALAPGFRGHVVINSGRYAVIDRNGDSKIEVLRNAPAQDPLRTASVPNEVLGTPLHWSDDVVRLGQRLKQPGWITLIGRSGSNGVVSAVVDFPASALAQSTTRLAATVRAVMRSTGALDVALVGDFEAHRDRVQAALRAGIVLDAIDANGDSMAGQISKTGPGFDNTKGAARGGPLDVRQRTEEQQRVIDMRRRVSVLRGLSNCLR